MSRRVITAEELLARPPLARPRPKKNGISPELRTAIVLRALAGEDPQCLALEVGRSAATVLMWCSHWRTGLNPHLFAARAFGRESRDRRPLLHLLDGRASAGSTRSSDGRP